MEREGWKERGREEGGRGFLDYERVLNILLFKPGIVWKNVDTTDSRGLEEGKMGT